MPSRSTQTYRPHQSATPRVVGGLAGPTPCRGPGGRRSSRPRDPMPARRPRARPWRGPRRRGHRGTPRAPCRRWSRCRRRDLRPRPTARRRCRGHGWPSRQPAMSGSARVTLTAIVMCDRKIKVGVWIRFVFECVMPPLAIVGAKTAGLHQRAKASPVSRFDLRDCSCSMMRGCIHQVKVTAHAGKLTGGQVIERQVNGAAPTMARLRRHISLFEHLGLGDIGVMSELRPAILGQLRPPQKAIHGALRAIAIPQEQAEAKRCGLSSRSFQGCAQGLRADDAIGEISVHRLAGEVVPRRVLRVPTDSGYELVDKDKISVHRPFGVSASDTIRSITSARGKPAAAIILG